LQLISVRGSIFLRSIIHEYPIDTLEASGAYEPLLFGRLCCGAFCGASSDSSFGVWFQLRCRGSCLQLSLSQLLQARDKAFKWRYTEKPMEGSPICSHVGLLDF
jgi:hypothetical protein